MNLKFTAFTLVLDGYRFLPHQFFTLSRLTIDWHWIIVHGAAANTGSTAWCKPQEPRLSVDGTTEFLKSLAGHPRITVIESAWWPGGKDQMCQAALDSIIEPTVLMQIDADELWTWSQLHNIYCEFWVQPEITCGRFDCGYMVGPNLRTVGRNCWGQNEGEFLRVWRFTPGQKMRHEPPFLEGVNGPSEFGMDNEYTRKRGYVFVHWAYAFEDQVAFKEKFYGYSGAVASWKKLQQYKGPFPTPLKPFFHWVNGNPMVDLLHKP